MLMLLIAACFIFCNATIAQNVGIGTATPNASAQLDISSTSKGMLVPRMTMAQRNAVVTPANGLLIYQTDNTPGFYFYNGSSWVSIAGSATLTGWSTTGNAGTTPATNFMGTTDDQPLSFKLNNTNAGKWDHLKGDYFIGLNTGAAITTGYSNIGIGTGTLAKTNTGKGNTSIGHFSMNYNTSGLYNVGIGQQALYTNTVGTYNTAIGINSLFGNTTGSHNTAVGDHADVSSGILTNATAIGANSEVGCSNCLTLGGTGANAVNVGIGTTTPVEKLEVNGNIKLSGEIHTPSTGSVNMIPFAFGRIKDDGTVIVSTNNFTVSHNSNYPGSYQITFAPGSNLNEENTVIVATIFDPNNGGSKSVSYNFSFGYLIIKTFFLSTHLHPIGGGDNDIYKQFDPADADFSFIVYKIN